MDYQQLESLRKGNPAWRLLAADNAVLVASFLHRTFIVPNVRTCAEPELVSKLDDLLYHLRRVGDAGAFPREAGDYLDDWASDRCGWLRKYYTADADEPVYDLAPTAELALAWLAGLGTRSFIGTQSRLITIFQILRQLVQATEADPDARVRELKRQRAEIDAEIGRISEGRIDILDPARVRDRFQEVVAGAKSLLADFRAVEQNFRDLDRDVRERIANLLRPCCGRGVPLSRQHRVGRSDPERGRRGFESFRLSLISPQPSSERRRNEMRDRQ